MTVLTAEQKALLEELRHAHAQEYRYRHQVNVLLMQVAESGVKWAVIGRALDCSPEMLRMRVKRNSTRVAGPRSGS